MTGLEQSYRDATFGVVVAEAGWMTGLLPLVTSNATVVVLDGQHNGSLALYLAYSPRIRASFSIVACNSDASARLSMTCGDSVPANFPSTNTNV
jgi:hypothetical protein